MQAAASAVMAWRRWPSHKVLELDVTDKGSETAAVREAIEGAGRTDVLVNNSGVGNFGGGMRLK